MIFLDANVIVDILSAREGYIASSKILEDIKDRKEKGCLSAFTVPIVWYVMGENRKFLKEIESLIRYFKIMPLNLQMLNTSFSSQLEDFEGPIQLNSAIKGKCSVLITRNKKDFASSKMLVLTPEEFLALKK